MLSPQRMLNVAFAFVPTKMELNSVNFLAVTTSTAPA
ncbi:hypothetical protein ACFX1T_009066 [Malus domestica]